ncbi:hypothetical protein Thermo_00632 [Thermoplasmatales archaeon]|nr:hypothetical protein Thermo_00632 [Thermoplasmatales archaeon]
MVKSMDELKDRIDQYFHEIDKYPVIFRRKYKMDDVTIV